MVYSVKRCVRGWTVLREELQTFVIIVRLVRAVVVGELLEVRTAVLAFSHGTSWRPITKRRSASNCASDSLANAQDSRSRAVLARKRNFGGGISSCDAN